MRMLQRIITLCLTVAAVLFGLALIWPVKAEQLAVSILKGIQTVEVAKLPLTGYKEPSLKIVDPTSVSSAGKEEASRLALLFRKSKDGTPGDDLIVEDIIDATNKARIAEGLEPLSVNVRLTASAKLKTEDMIKKGYFEHESPTGVSVSDLGGEVGYSYIIMGENLALGNFDGAGDLVQAWMDSPGHRANILNTMYREIGIYAAKGTFEGREVWFAVQHFGASRSACPTISATLKKEIDALNIELDRQQAEVEELKKRIENSNANEPGYEENVNLFNAMVNTYNQTLNVSRVKISEYNAQVAKFNSCLVKYQE